MQTATETTGNNLDGAQPVAQSVNPDSGCVLLLDARPENVYID